MTTFFFLKMSGSVLFGNCSPAIRYSPHKKFGAVAAVGFIKLKAFTIIKQIWLKPKINCKRNVG